MSMLPWRDVVCVRCGVLFAVWQRRDPKGGWVCRDCKGRQAR